jgi:hypothetical protein
LLAPWARWRRAESGQPDIMGDLEWLAGLMAELDRRAGKPPVTPAVIASATESALTVRQELIRGAEAMRTVFVAAAEAVAPAQPAAAACRPRRRGTPSPP